jgi:hypothetical protein
MHKDCYKPSEAQSIDESMIHFKGRPSFHQYMPQKPITRAYKVCIYENYIKYVPEFDSGKVGHVVEKMGPRMVQLLTKLLGRER